MKTLLMSLGLAAVLSLTPTEESKADLGISIYGGRNYYGGYPSRYYSSPSLYGGYYNNSYYGNSYYGSGFYNNSYYGNNYGGGHYHYYPTQIYRHYDHYHVTPGHYHYHGYGHGHGHYGW